MGTRMVPVVPGQIWERVAGDGEGRLVYVHSVRSGRAYCVPARKTCPGTPTEPANCFGVEIWKRDGVIPLKRFLGGRHYRFVAAPRPLYERVTNWMANYEKSRAKLQIPGRWFFGTHPITAHDNGIAGAGPVPNTRAAVAAEARSR
jgi:hypothetical protein